MDNNNNRRRRVTRLLKGEKASDFTAGAESGVGRLQKRTQVRKEQPVFIRGEGSPAQIRGDRAPRRAFGGGVGLGVISRAQGGDVEPPELDQQLPDDTTGVAPNSLPLPTTPVDSSAFPESMTAYKPTWREKIAQTLMGEKPASPTRQNFVKGLTGTTGIGEGGLGLVDVTPAGMALGAQESLQHGDPQGAALSVMPMGPAMRGARGVQRQIIKDIMGADRALITSSATPKLHHLLRNIEGISTGGGGGGKTTAAVVYTPPYAKRDIQAFERVLAKLSPRERAALYGTGNIEEQQSIAARNKTLGKLDGFLNDFYERGRGHSDGWVRRLKD